MIVTAHQPNFLPGLSIIEKIHEADAVIWLDWVEFSHGGWTNRNQMPDGSWLTVPVAGGSGDGTPIAEVRIGDHGSWRRRHSQTLRQQYAGQRIGVLVDEIMRPYGKLVGLNLALLRVLLAGSTTAWHFQSHLDGGDMLRADEVVTEDPAMLIRSSERLAAMVAELGGKTYLSGPSGKNYLHEEPFVKRGIAVEYFRWSVPNRCAVERVATPRGA